MAERQGDPLEDPDDRPEDDEVDPSQVPGHEPYGPRIPPDDPADHERNKRFLVRDPPLEVRVSDGAVRRSYAPAGLIAGLSKAIDEVMRALGGGWGPMLYGAVPGHSMILYFGDPEPDEAQTQLPVEITAQHAKRVAELMELDGDELFARAVEIGAPSRAYADFAHFVESEGITLTWRPRGERPRTLQPGRAASQCERLLQEPEMHDRTMRINGVLYRVIAEPREGHLGTLGIRLHSWSRKPPSRHRQGNKVLAAYDSEEVELAIKSGLIGEPVEALLRIREPLPYTSIDPNRVELVVDEVTRGPDEYSNRGIPMWSPLDDE